MLTQSDSISLLNSDLPVSTCTKNCKTLCVTLRYDINVVVAVVVVVLKMIE